MEFGGLSGHCSIYKVVQFVFTMRITNTECDHHENYKYRVRPSFVFTMRIRNTECDHHEN